MEISYKENDNYHAHVVASLPAHYSGQRSLECAQHSKSNKTLSWNDAKRLSTARGDTVSRDQNHK